MNRLELDNLIKWMKKQMVITPYGSLQITMKFHDGKVVLIERSVTIKSKVDEIVDNDTSKKIIIKRVS